MKKIFVLNMCLLVISCAGLKAQTDPHFTQNYTYPLYINPALTGSSDGDYRVSAVYRSQWGSVGNPYRTIGVSGDMRTPNNLAVGVNILKQSAGDAGFNYVTAYASVAYSGVRFGSEEKHRIVFAMQGGVMDRRIDESKFQWGEQWNPVTGYNALNPTSESFANRSATTLDLGAGILYYDAGADQKANAFAGLSVFHINKPRDLIITSDNGDAYTIPYRYVVHGGASINLSDDFRLVPHALLMRQGTAGENMIGIYAQKNINSQTDLMLGAYYRNKDAIAPFVGVDFQNFLIGLSYDLNTSTLGRNARNINSFELSLSFVERKDSESIFSFFRCPRL